MDLVFPLVHNDQRPNPESPTPPCLGLLGSSQARESTQLILAFARRLNMNGDVGPLVENV